MGTQINILAMDGGNGMNTGTLLANVQSANGKDFLNQTDIFVGTSAGGINSLFFAAADNQTDALTRIQSFWNDVNLSILGGLQDDNVLRGAAEGLRNSLANTVVTGKPQELPENILQGIQDLGCALVGFRSLFLNDVMKDFLTRYFKDFPTLADLKKRVIIVSFKLDNEKQGIDRSWEPRLFTNLPYQRTKEKDPVRSASETLNTVDIAMRTSAIPLGLPIYQSSDGTGPGYTDGALVANNPAMIALAAIVGTLSQGTVDLPPVPPTESLKDIHLLSVGTGRNLVGTAQFLDPEFTNGSASWGYRQWLLDPKNLLVLIDAFLQGGNESVAFQCDRLLGEQNFHRLNVPLTNMLVPSDPVTAARVVATSRWLDSSGWFKPVLRTIAAGPVRLRPGMMF